MKIFNYTKILLSRDLWHFIAKNLGIEGRVRDADLFDRKELAVVVAQRPASLDNHYYGFHCPGRIDIFTCPDCTPGSILRTYIHELFHAYLYQLGDVCYFNVSEVLVEHQAKRLYTLAGGCETDTPGCGRYTLEDTDSWKQNKRGVLHCLAESKAILCARTKGTRSEDMHKSGATIMKGLVTDLSKTMGTKAE